MAAGEYVSVTSQRETFEQDRPPARELLSYPAETAQELARLYEVSASTRTMRLPAVEGSSTRNARSTSSPAGSSA
jgi:hypothetical protein